MPLIMPLFIMKYPYTFNLKDKNSNKASLIYLRARIKREGKYLKYSTGEKILPEHWDFETQWPKKIKGRTKEAIEINSIINQISRYGETFEKICTKLEAQNIELNVNLIKGELDYEFKKSTSAPNSFFTVFNQFIQEKKDLGNITSGTIARYENIKTLLQQFSEEKKYILNFSSINEDFYVKWINYSREKLEHKNNTLGRNIGFIKTFMNWAMKKKYHTNFAFKDFKKISSETDEIALSLEELDKLYNYDLTEHPKLERVRDVFILGCATGMRYSDYSRIAKWNIRNDQIHMNTKKGKSNIGVPLNKYSKGILEKYNYELPKISAQKFRDYIKDACKIAGMLDDVIKTSFIGNKRIEKIFKKHQLVSTHTARRTFITISLDKGMRPEIVMSITGHKSYSNFKKYIKLSNKSRELEMQRTWN
jgi:site-specific recombinase XerD